MLTEETRLGSIDIENNLKTISIAVDSVILKDGEEIAKTRHRKAFIPGDITGVKDYLGMDDSAPEIIYINALWTQEVIDTYNNAVSE